MKYKSILVTGGSGLVGNAIRQIADERFLFLSSKDCNLLDYSKSIDKISKIQPDCVIHLAANVGGLFKNINQKVQMFEDNVLINLNILKICKKLNIKKFVGCLSTCIFPDETSYPIDENMLFDGPPHDSNYGYAYAKRMLEIQCRTYREQYNLDYNCVIPTNIYGPYDNFNLEDAHVIPALINKCFLAKNNNEDFVVAGSGSPVRQFVYSLDLAKIIIKLLEIEYNETIIISPEEEISILDISTIIANKFEYIDRMKFDISKPDGQHKKTASNKRLRNIIPDYKFTDIKEGLNKTIDWFLENQDKVRV
jgi:GDP-L-fucose synthase